MHQITNNKVRILLKNMPQVLTFQWLNLEVTKLNKHSEIPTSHNPLNQLNQYTTTPKCFQANFKDNQIRIYPIPQYKNGSKIRTTYRQNLNSSSVNEIIVIINKNKILQILFEFIFSLQYFNEGRIRRIIQI
jgi:hypothetical protein